MGLAADIDPEEFIALGATTLYEAMGRGGALDGAIRPLSLDMAVAGPAFTITAEDGGNLALHRAVAEAPAKAVLVVQTAGDVDTGLWGDILSQAAMAAGIAGLVTEGAVRDVRAIIALGFPVFCRNVSMRGPSKVDGTLGRTITCGGMRIAPGDLIIGDADGVLAIPRSSIEPARAKARERAAFEDRVRHGLRNGRTTLELMDLAQPAERLRA
jgi:4-hydroxy-4-methyl-2-oxoglutarate aldolase